jgi:hypothetical protein
MEQEARQKKEVVAGADGDEDDEDSEEVQSGVGIGEKQTAGRQSNYALLVRTRLHREWRRRTAALLQQWWIKLRCTFPVQSSALTLKPPTVTVTTTAQVCHGAAVLAMLAQHLSARRELLKVGAIPALLGLLDHCYLRYGKVCVGFGDDIKLVSKREMNSRARAALRRSRSANSDGHESADSAYDDDDDDDDGDCDDDESNADIHDRAVDQYDVDVTIRGIEDEPADGAGENVSKIRRLLGGPEQELILRQRALLYAARAVSMLTLSADCRREMVEYGAVQTLCSLCSGSGNSSSEIKSSSISSAGVNESTTEPTMEPYSNDLDDSPVESQSPSLESAPVLVPLPPPVLVHIAAALGQLAADGRAQLVLVREGVAKVLVQLCCALVSKLEAPADGLGKKGAQIEATDVVETAAARGYEESEPQGNEVKLNHGASSVETAAAMTDVASTLSHVTQAISGLASGAATRVQLVNTGVLQPLLQLCTILTATPSGGNDVGTVSPWQMVQQQQQQHHHQATLLYAVQSLCHLANDGSDEANQFRLLERQVVHVLVGMLKAHTSHRRSRQSNKNSDGIEGVQGGGKINSTVLHLIVEILLSLARASATTTVGLITVAIPATTAADTPDIATSSYEWGRQQSQQKTQSQRMVRRHPLMVMATEGALALLGWVLDHENGASENSLVLSGALQMVAQLASRADVSTALLDSEQALAMSQQRQSSAAAVGDPTGATNVITPVLEVLRRGATVGLDVQCDACVVLRNIARHGNLDGSCVWSAGDDVGAAIAADTAAAAVLTAGAGAAGATKIAAAAAAGAGAVCGDSWGNRADDAAGGRVGGSISHRRQLVNGGVLPRLVLLLRLATGLRYNDVEAIAAERLQGVTSAAAATAAAASAARAAKTTRNTSNRGTPGNRQHQSIDRGGGDADAAAEAVAAAVIGLGQGDDDSDDDDTTLAVAPLTMGDSNAIAAVDPEKISAEQWALVGMAAAVVANICVDGVCARQAVSHFDALILLVQVARTALRQWERRRQQQELQLLRKEQQQEERKRQAQRESGWASSFWQQSSSSEATKPTAQSGAQFLSKADLEGSVAESDADLAASAGSTALLGGIAGEEHVQSILGALRHTAMAIANVCEHAGGRVSAIETGAAAPLIETLQQHMHAHIAHEEQRQAQGGTRRGAGGTMDVGHMVYDHAAAMHALRGLSCLACEAAGRLELVHSFPQTIAVLMQLIVIGGSRLDESTAIGSSTDQTGQAGDQTRFGSGFGGAAAANDGSGDGTNKDEVGWAHLVCGAVMVLHHMAEDAAYRAWLVEKKVVKALVDLCVTTHNVADGGGGGGEDGSSVVVVSATDGPALVAATLALSRFAEHDRTRDVLVPGGVMWFSGGSALINIISEPNRFQPRVLAHAAATIGVLAMDISSRPELMELGVSRPLVKVGQEHLPL